MRIEDIRPADTDGGKWDAIHRDVAWLADRKDGFEPANCPACGGDQPVALYEKFGIDHVRCGACATQYANPRPTERMLIEFYQLSANYAFWADVIYPQSEDYRSEELFNPRAELAADAVRKQGLTGSPLLEVGAGYGLFCEQARATGAFGDIFGIEPTPKLAEICRGRGITVFESGYEDVTLPEKPALIASFETIEHLHSPKKFIDWCFDQLVPGGSLLLTCPNIAGFETVSLGQISETIDHQHINLFNPTSLSTLLERAGFRDIVVETPGKLDVQLVRSAFDAGRIGADDLGPFGAWLVQEADDDQRSAFQEYLARVGFSSHMRTLAVRPA